ncbi:hypothetical protein XENOCAPTIV_008813, partial [Xenoophorus captivus]
KHQEPYKGHWCVCLTVIGQEAGATQTRLLNILNGVKDEDMNSADAQRTPLFSLWNTSDSSQE